MTEQISPDGFYRWDGSRRLPTGKVPSGTPFPAAVTTKAGAIAASRTTVRARMAAAAGADASATVVENGSQRAGNSYVARDPRPGPEVPTSKKKMAVEALELKKHFGKQKVLDGVTFGIPEGEITMIMGPSGTGKSVFLRHVVGLMFPDAGDIKVDGHSVPNLSTEELLELRHIAALNNVIPHNSATTLLGSLNTENEGSVLCGPNSQSSTRAAGSAVFTCKTDPLQSQAILGYGTPPPALFSGASATGSAPVQPGMAIAAAMPDASIGRDGLFLAVVIAVAGAIGAGYRRLRHS
jgi:hypothetical protein